MARKAKLKYRIAKAVWGQCRTCGRPNKPLHTCRMKFTRRNATMVEGRGKK